MHKRLLLLLVLLSSTVFATSIKTDDEDGSNAKPYWGANGLVSLALGNKMGEYPFTPAVSFRYRRNEFFFGLDMYSLKRRILGSQVGFKYFYLYPTPRFSLYAQANIEFVNYSSGYAKNQRFNYVAADSTDLNGLIKCNLFLFSVGTGFDLKLGKNLNAFMLVGYGLNSTSRTYLRKDIPKILNDPPQEGRERLTHLFLQTGFKIRLTKK